MAYIAQEPPYNPSQLPEYLSREMRRVETSMRQEYVFNNGVNIMSGRGSPEGEVAAPPGSLYLNSAGGASTSLYVKETGTSNTGWVAK